MDKDVLREKVKDPHQRLIEVRYRLNNEGFFEVYIKGNGDSNKILGKIKLRYHELYTEIQSLENRVKSEGYFYVNRALVEVAFRQSYQMGKGGRLQVDCKDGKHICKFYYSVGFRVQDILRFPYENSSGYDYADFKTLFDQFTTVESRGQTPSAQLVQSILSHPFFTNVLKNQAIARYRAYPKLRETVNNKPLEECTIRDYLRLGSIYQDINDEMDYEIEAAKVTGSQATTRSYGDLTMSLPDDKLLEKMRYYFENPYSGQKKTHDILPPVALDKPIPVSEPTVAEEPVAIAPEAMPESVATAAPASTPDPIEPIAEPDAETMTADPAPSEVPAMRRQSALHTIIEEDITTGSPAPLVEPIAAVQPSLSHEMQALSKMMHSEMQHLTQVMSKHMNFFAATVRTISDNQTALLKAIQQLPTPGAAAATTPALTTVPVTSAPATSVPPNSAPTPTGTATSTVTPTADNTTHPVDKPIPLTNRRKVDPILQAINREGEAHTAETQLRLEQMRKQTEERRQRRANKLVRMQELAEKRRQENERVAKIRSDMLHHSGIASRPMKRDRRPGPTDM